MQQERAKNTTAKMPAASAESSEPKREVSSILFPYGDLDNAIDFVKTIHKIGGQSCQIEQLAGFLKVAPDGGAFRMRLAHPRIFGLAAYERGVVSLTPLGLKIVDSGQEAAARVEAFLSVPLYKAIYDKYRGYTLPPAAALEREMLGLGVSSKQTDKARQVFERSARQAGFFWAGTERLTLPVIKSKPESRPVEEPPSTPPQQQEIRNGDSGGGNGGGRGGYHPFILGLLDTLPQPQTVWAIEGRAAWLEAAASAFKLIYKGDGRITINADSERNAHKQDDRQ